MSSMYRKLVVSFCLMASLIFIQRVPAERCIGPHDNTAGHGVDPISQADITWCDDFDSYCDNNCGDLCNPAWPAHSVWPGYPPTPDNLCSTSATDPGGGTNDSSEYYFRRPFHWPRPTVTGSGWSSSAPGVWPSRWEGWNGNAGWMTEPYSMMYQGGGNTNQYHTFSLLGAIQNKWPGSTAMNGTDGTPMTLRFWTNTDWNLKSAPSNWPFYVELRLDDGQAPTNYIEMYCSGNLATYPIVCQQRVTPAGCPANSVKTYSSLAFGWLAHLDANPCDTETGRKPTQYHAAAFDGNIWHQLNGGEFAGQVDKFNYDVNQAFFEMKVKSITCELKLTAYRQKSKDDPTFELITSTATMPRVYLGPFNKISVGAAPGCKLNPQTGECLTSGQYDVWRYMQSNSDYGWSKAYLDRLAVLGGVSASAEGACCLPDGSCDSKTSSACATAGGQFRDVGEICGENTCLGACCQPLGVCTNTTSDNCPGNYQGIGTSCGTPPCPCPKPFADFDEDKDVDQIDFGYFQQCFTGADGAIAAGCECFDRDDNDKIDQVDFLYFEHCWSGPSMPAVPACETWTP